MSNCIFSSQFQNMKVDIDSSLFFSDSVYKNNPHKVFSLLSIYYNWVPTHNQKVIVCKGRLEGGHLAIFFLEKIQLMTWVDKWTSFYLMELLFLAQFRKVICIIYFLMQIGAFMVESELLRNNSSLLQNLDRMAFLLQQGLHFSINYHIPWETFC